MEASVYKVIKELHDLVVGDGKNILSSSDIASLKATLHTLLVVYSPDNAEPEPHDIGEARRPPKKKSKPKFWW